MIDLTSGNCAGHADPELWFRGLHAWRDAVAICQTCPVRQECLASALSHELLDWQWRLADDQRARPMCSGVWGGLTARQRTQLLDEGRRRRDAARFVA